MLGELFDLLDSDTHKLPYLMTGKVIGNFNPLHPACVQVSLPERTPGMNITAWARVAMPFAGSGNGAYALPAIGDEVVVAFLNGEIDSPLVLGSLHGMTKQPPTGAVHPLNLVKCVKTSLGHTITLDDTPVKPKVEIKTASGISVTLEDLPPSLTLKDTVGDSIVLDGKQTNITINGTTGVTVKSGSCEVTLDGKTQSVTLKGLRVVINANQEISLSCPQIKIKGQMVSVEADGKLDVASNGITSVKGSMVKIN